MTGVSPFFYDISEGRVLIGLDAREHAIESGVHPADIIPLRDVLVSPESYPEPPPHGIPRGSERWTKQEAIAVIHWVGTHVLEKTDTIHAAHLLELRKLGFGPQERIYRKYGGLLKLYEQAGLEKRPPARREYDDWDVDDFTEYVCSYARRTPASQSLIKALEETHGGPSYSVISRRVDGGLAALLTRGGFYDFQHADDEYYIEWGIDFMFSNNGRFIDSEACSILSPKRKAPARTRISPRFGSMQQFNEIVQSRYFEESERIQARAATKFEDIMEGLHLGELPTELFLECDSPEEMRARAGKYQLITKLCPAVQQESKTRYAKGSVRNVVHQLRLRESSLSAGEIESAAITLDVYEDVWPVQRAKPSLQI